MTSQEVPILLAKEFDAEKLVFIDNPPKEGTSRSVRIKYLHDEESDPERLIMQSARMKIPFGISNNLKFVTDKKNVVDTSKLKWDLQLSFAGEERSKRIQRFRKAIDDFDNRCKDSLVKNGNNWIP